MLTCYPVINAMDLYWLLMAEYTHQLIEILIFDILYQSSHSFGNGKCKNFACGKCAFSRLFLDWTSLVWLPCVIESMHITLLLLSISVPHPFQK